MRALPAALLVLAFVGAALAGCLSAPASKLSTAAAVEVPRLLAQNASLWPDHENEPHPGWDWPTLTHPAVGGKVPALWQPIPNATLPAHVAGLKHLAHTPPEVAAGAGIAIFGRIALVPSDGKETYVVNISDPANPTLLSKYPNNGSERGAAFMPFPDGRLYATVSTTPGFDVVNLTDPANPVIVAQVKPVSGGHKVGVVPGTPFVYNANSKGGGGPAFGVQGDVPGQGAGVTEIYDLSDPEHPKLVQNFPNGYGCHHIFFWIDGAKDKERAICAGIEYTQIWDIKDPAHPKVIVSVPVHSGIAGAPATSVAPVVFSHFSILNQDGTILIVGDEFMGGGTAECDGVNTPAGNLGGPLGALWFYDVKDETSPKLLGHFAPEPKMLTNPDATAGCTAHHGRLVPDPEGKRQLIAMAWYADGVVLIDFTDPQTPTMVDEWNDGTNTWEAWYDNGYVFTGDLNRGLDVLTLR